MKIDRIIWGILFLFVGGVVLLDNFDVINFYWRNVWQFWPVILIIGGVNVLLGKKESNIGAIITLVVLLVTLGYLFYRGQQPPSHSGWMSDNFHTKFDFDDDDNNNDRDSSRYQVSNFSEPYNNTNIKHAMLSIYCGGTSLELKGATDKLISGDVRKRVGDFTFEKSFTDSTCNLTLRLADKKGHFSVGNGSNDIDLRMNNNPDWDIDMHMGAGAIDLDLSAFKIRNVNFDGGAASVDVKLGDLLPVANVAVKAGVADVNIRVPEGAGCEIRTNTGLSAKDFDGFEKISSGLYRTANFSSSAKKIFIKLDGGLSNFEVHRY